MKRYNHRIKNKPVKEMYQLYYPDLEFYLEKTIEYGNILIELLNEQHEEIFLNSKNKKSNIIPLILEKKIVKKNKKIIQESVQETIRENSESEESENSESEKSEEIKEIKQKIYNLLDDYIKKNELNIIRKKFIDSLNLNEYNKVRIWNIIKEILDWKNSKTGIVYGSKKITITY